MRREAHPSGHFVEALPEARGIYHPRGKDEHRHSGVFAQLRGEREGQRPQGGLGGEVRRGVTHPLGGGDHDHSTFSALQHSWEEGLDAHYCTTQVHAMGSVPGFQGQFQDGAERSDQGVVD